MLARIRCGVGIAAVVVMFGAQHPATAQPPEPGAESASAAPARELAQPLEQGQLDSIAAKDSEGDDRFVAALYFPGRLLVVSARYEVPMFVEAKIAAQEYREVYLDLNTASIVESLVLIGDGGADGLVNGDLADSAQVNGLLVRFGGDWSGQELSELEYASRFSEADLAYTRILQALLGAVPWYEGCESCFRSV
ncbi:MAG: hypothetical protein OSB03_07865 [Vicinamibacterales bacterium]|jgi:hypothetical protein|nr:hypothetical protein [Vicinamibacterales bacterium]